jgi:hypothetical protein
MAMAYGHKPTCRLYGFHGLSAQGISQQGIRTTASCTHGLGRRTAALQFPHTCSPNLLVLPRAYST